MRQSNINKSLLEKQQKADWIDFYNEYGHDIGFCGALKMFHLNIIDLFI